MRAIIASEPFLSNYIGNARSYSKPGPADHIKLSATAINGAAAEEKPLVKKFLEFVKSWGGSQPEFPNYEMQEAEGDGCPKIRRVAMIGSQSVQMHDNFSGIHVHRTTFDTDPQSQVIRCQSPPIDAMLTAIPSQQLGKASVIEQLGDREIVAQRKSKSLLTYPVLPLQETLGRYLESVQPLVDDAEILQQQKITMDFYNNEGLELQARLEHAARSSDNWLTDDWTKAAFLRYRAPLTVFSSPCLTFPKQNFRNTLDYVDFTARAIFAMCEFKNMVENDQLGVGTLDGLELDNSQFHNVFGTVRIPGRGCDILQQCNSNYVVVIHRNNFYKLIVLDAGRILNVYAIRKQLLKILNSGREFGPAVGLLTHDKRDNWAEGHDMICRKPENARNIQCIEQSLFTISLDEEIDVAPNDGGSQQAAQIMHGGGSLENSANRWMDKALQLIVNPNGMAGICCEHAPAEPQPAASVLDYILKKIYDPKYGKDEQTTHSIAILENITFSEIDECVDFWLRTADRTVNEISKRLEVRVFNFDCYGSKLIAERSLEPDGFVQMALQLAFHRLHNELPAQQELAHLRIFKFGRTEIIRCTSNESLKFVLAMTSRTAKDTDRLSALDAAVGYHRHLAMLALKGRGIDRHLFGLEQMAIEHGLPLPKFFQSEGFQKSRDFRVLSTQLMTPHDSVLVYGPLNSDGYACCYNMREHDIIFAVSSWNHNATISATSFGMALQSALADMGHLLLTRNRPMFDPQPCTMDD